MALLGPAAIAMWWDMATAHRVEFEDWHSHEHFPERLGIPGFLRGSRWADASGGPGFFVMYELQHHETLSSPAYLERLNNPTPWSRKLMPHHGNMVRSQCRVLESIGGGVGHSALTIRLSPQAGRDAALRAHLREVFASIPSRPGIAGGHLLHTQPPQLAQTQEQKIRGGADSAADWIVLAIGYESSMLQALEAAELSQDALADAGAKPGAISGLYDLRLSMTPADAGTAAMTVRG